MAEFNSTRASAIVAHHALIAQHQPCELRFTEGTYHALELASPRPETRLEVRTYAAGAAFQYLDGDAKRRGDFIAAIKARFPGGVPITVRPHTYLAQFADDPHGRDYVYGNWSFAENGIRFTGDQAESKMAIRALIAVEIAKLMHPIAYAI